MQEPTRRFFRGRPTTKEEYERTASCEPAGVVAAACRQWGPDATREAPAVIRSRDQLAARERQAGPFGVAERSVLPKKPGNVGGGKGPQLKTKERSDKEQGIGDEPNNPVKCSEVADDLTRKSEGIA